MMLAQKECLKYFFNGNNQYIVPFFQRKYVWDIENWEELWDSIQGIKSMEVGKEHFIGTIITKQIPAGQIAENKHDLIDGQQRLTTIAILIRAMADRSSGKGEFFALKRNIERSIAIENNKGEVMPVISHNKIDAYYFNDIIINGADSECYAGFIASNGYRKFKKNVRWELLSEFNRLVVAYYYFYSKLEKYQDTDIDQLYTVLLHRVPVISMLLGKNDNEQEIFDTTNSLGVRLTVAELLKNHIFRDEKLHSQYGKLWKDVFEADEEQRDFWNKEKTTGRITRTNIEILLYCYLIIQTKAVVKIENLFKEYKNWLEKKDKDDVITFLRELKDYADIYQSFPEGANLQDIRHNETEKLFFHSIEKLSVTTIYPLILYIHKHVTDKEERVKYIKILDAYIVRRNICRYTTKNYNNLFISIIRALEKSRTADSLIDSLKEHKDFSNIFPSNLVLRNAFDYVHLTNSNATEILYRIALFLQNDKHSENIALNASTFTLEHIMPKKWRLHWNNPPLNADDEVQRDSRLLTLGNLTLLTGKLNNILKNSGWDKKRHAMGKFSALRITTNYLGQEVWDESAIEKRAEDLYQYALEVWPNIH